MYTYMFYVLYNHTYMKLFGCLAETAGRPVAHKMKRSTIFVKFFVYPCKVYLFLDLSI